MAIVIVCKATSIIDGGAIDDKGNNIIYTLLHNKYVGKMIATCANYHQTLNAIKVAVKRPAHAINCFHKFCNNKAVYSTKL